jgi:hypothetical protein
MKEQNAQKLMELTKQIGEFWMRTTNQSIQRTTSSHHYLKLGSLTFDGILEARH